MSLEEQLSEDFSGRESILGKFSDVESLARSYQELQRNMGDATRIPAPEASKDEHREFFQRLGTPDSPEGYKVPDGLEDWASEARGAAHSANLTQDQWSSLAAAQQEAQQTMSGSMEDALQRTRERYGEHYDASLEAAKGAIEALSEHSEVLADSLGGVDLRDEAAHELFSVIGGLMMDGSTPEEMSGEKVEQDDDMGIAIRCREIMKSPAFTDRRDPEHEKIKAEYYTKFTSLLKRGYNGVSDPRLRENPLAGIDISGVGNE
jgi:hypothetical protein